MRKLLTFLFAMFMATNFINAASDVNLGDFEGGTVGTWQNYGVSPANADNPITTGNASAKALKFDYTAKYAGIRVTGLTINVADYDSFTFKVYNSSGAVQYIVNVKGTDGAGAAKTVSGYPYTVAGGWAKYKLALSAATIANITEVQLQSNADVTSSLYFDDIVFHAKPSNPPTSLTLSAIVNSVIVGKKLNTTVAVLPANAGSQVTYASLDATIVTISATGVVTALKAGTVGISAISTLAATVGDTLTLTVTDPAVASSMVQASFENGTNPNATQGGWNGSGTPVPIVTIVDNPSTTGNSSAKVLKVQECNQYAAAVKTPAIDLNKYTKIKFKVYSDSAYADFQLTMNINNSLQEKNSTVGIVKQTWTEYEYVIDQPIAANGQFYIKMNSPKSKYRKVATNLDSLGYTFFIDSIVFVAGDGSKFYPVKGLAIQGTGNVNAISADNGTLQMEAIFTPDTASNKAFSWSLVSQNADTATLSATGLLTAVRNANVKVKAVSVDGGIVAEKVIAVTGQKVGIDSMKIKPFSIAFPDTLTTNGASVRIDTIVKFYPADATNKTIKWSIKGDTLNTISASGLFEAFHTGESWVIAISDTNATAKDSIKIVVSGQQIADSINISGSNDSITVNGGTMQLTTIFYPTATRVSDLSWTVSNAKASVSADGLVTALDNGTVWIKGTTIDGSNKSDSVMLTIVNQINADSVVISGLSAITKNDSTLTLTATVYPAIVSNKSVTWSIIGNDTDTATISVDGVITPKRNGTIIVKAVSVATPSKYDTLIVIISGQIVEIKTIAFGQIADSIKTNNGTLQFAVNFTPADATNKAINFSLVGIDTDTATISSTGLLTAIRNGKVTVMAVSAQDTSKKITKTIVITNQIVEVEKVELGNDVLITTKGGTVQLKPKFTPIDAADTTVTYSVKDTNIVVISTKGLISAKKTGETWINLVAKDGGHKDSVKVSVYNQIPFNISTFEGDVPYGTEIVTIDSKKYLKMPLKGWSSAFGIVEVVATAKTTATFTYKVDKDTSTVAAYQSFIQFASADWATKKAITENPAATAFKEITSTLAEGKFSNFQLAVQGTSGSWPAVTGPIMYISQVVIKNPIAVTKVTISGGDKIDTKAGTLTLTAAVTPTDATDKTVTWSVDKAAIATINAKTGVLTAVSDGSVVVTATANDGSKVVATVTVTVSNQSVNVANTSTANLRVYPNPAAEVLRIAGSESFNSVAIFNIDGKLVQRLENIASNSDINIAGLTKGIYVVKVTFGNNTASMQFVKR